MTADRLNIAPGLALPFWPMRPRIGVKLTSDNVRAVIEEMSRDYVLQPKMNGDRVTIATVNGVVHAFHRKLGRYTFKFNRAAWSMLPNCTCLDGEVKDGEFHPFELLALAGESWLSKPVETRIEGARMLCKERLRPYAFFSVLDDGTSWGPGVGSEYLANHTNGTVKPSTAPYWEGVVAKLKGSRYTIFGCEKDSPNWVKLKFSWCL